MELLTEAITVNLYRPEESIPCLELIATVIAEYGGIKCRVCAMHQRKRHVARLFGFGFLDFRGKIAAKGIDLETMSQYKKARPFRELSYLGGRAELASGIGFKGRE